MALFERVAKPAIDRLIAGLVLIRQNFAVGNYVTENAASLPSGFFLKSSSAFFAYNADFSLALRHAQHCSAGGAFKKPIFSSLLPHITSEPEPFGYTVLAA